MANVDQNLAEHISAVEDELTFFLQRYKTFRRTGGFNEPKLQNYHNCQLAEKEHCVIKTLHSKFPGDYQVEILFKKDRAKVKLNFSSSKDELLFRLKY